MNPGYKCGDTCHLEIQFIEDDQDPWRTLERNDDDKSQSLKEIFSSGVEECEKVIHFAFVRKIHKILILTQKLSAEEFKICHKKDFEDKRIQLCNLLQLGFKSITV